MKLEDLAHDARRAFDTDLLANVSDPCFSFEKVCQSKICQHHCVRVRVRMFACAASFSPALTPASRQARMVHADECKEGRLGRKTYAEQDFFNASGFHCNQIPRPRDVAD